MTEKGTPPLPRPSGGEGEKMSRALNTYPNVSRRKSWPYKTVHWQALIKLSMFRSRRFEPRHLGCYKVEK